MSDPYYPDSQDDEQEIPFDQYDESFDQDPPPQRRGQGSQPEWQSSNPNTQQDQWGQQQGGRKRKDSSQSDQMNAQDPDDDSDMRAAGQGNQANSQYPRPSPQSQGAPDDIDDDAEYWRDDDWREDPSTW